MVIAILKDRKTHTRRKIRGVVSGDVYLGNVVVDIYHKCGRLTGQIKSSTPYARFTEGSDETRTKLIRIPNQPGDIIWVRESFCQGNSNLLDNKTIKFWTFFADGGQIYSTGQFAPGLESYIYGTRNMGEWKPSIHMPMEAARIWLECVACYPQKIQAISPSDCVAEGVWFDEGSGYWFASDSIMEQSEVDAFRMLWYDINGVASWLDNPWVWVRVFRVISKTGKPTEL